MPALGSDDSVSACDMSRPGQDTSSRRHQRNVKLRMMDEDSDGVRIKIIPCAKEQFRRRIEATKVLEDDFSVPNQSTTHARFLAEAW